MRTSTVLPSAVRYIKVALLVLAWSCQSLDLSGVLAFEYLASQSGARTPASMLGSMFSGMVWGMVVSVALYRLYFRVRPMIALNLDRHGAGML